MARLLQSATLKPAELSADQQLAAYNALDCCITFEVFEALKPKLTEVPFAYDFERTMQAPAFTMMRRGTRINLNQLGSKIQELKIERDKFSACFERLASEGLGMPLDPKGKVKVHRSPAQLKDLFYNRLGLKPILVYNKETKQSEPSTNRDSLEKLAKQADAVLARPFIELILELRDVEKQLSVLESGIDEDGRLRCGYNVAGTLSGRWSSNSHPFGSGQNLQNIADSIRQIFIPETGYKFCQLDLKQAESLGVAYFASPWGKNYLQACLSGDPHTIVSELCWPEFFAQYGNLPLRDRKKLADTAKFYRDFSYRDLAKRGGHGTNYVGKPYTIAQHIKVPTGVAETFQRKYFSAFPEIRSWHNHIRMQLSSTRTIHTPFGRRNIFLGRPWDDDTIKKAVAYGPQSTIADALNTGLLKVWRAFDAEVVGPGATYNGVVAPSIMVLNQVHDSILFQYDPEFESVIVPAVAIMLETPIEINGLECVIGVDIKVGWNWGKVRKGKEGVDNPYGLQDWEQATGDARTPPPAESFNLLDRMAGGLHRLCKLPGIIPALGRAHNDRSTSSTPSVDNSSREQDLPELVCDADWPAWDGEDTSDCALQGDFA